MANRAAFEIDLPVEELKGFIADYKSFRQQLKEQPEEWAAVGDAISDLLDPIDKIMGAVSGIGTAQAEAIQSSAAMIELVQRRQKMTEEQTNLVILQRQDLEERIARRKLDQQKKDDEAAKKNKGSTDIFAVTVTKSAKLFTQIDQTSARTLVSLRDSTMELLKWGGILTGVGTLLGGLVGAGGLFGISDLAKGVMNRSRDAQGAGVTYGESQAFSTDYQSLLDSPSGVLESLANAKNDPRIGRSLTALGIPAQDQQKDPAQLAPEVMTAVRALYKSDPAAYGMVSEAYGIQGLGFSNDDARRLASETPQQLQATANQFQSDSQTMNLPANVQQEWTALARMLDRTKSILETDLVNALTPLAPTLTALSSDLIGVVATLIQMPEVKAGLQQVDDWLKQFSAYLKSDKFTQDLTTWEADLKPILEDIKSDFQSFQKGLQPNGIKGHWTGIPYLSRYVADDPKDQSKVPFMDDPTVMNDLGTDQGHKAVWEAFKKWFYNNLSGGGAFGGLGGATYQNQALVSPFGAPRSMIVQADYTSMPDAFGGGSGGQFSGLEATYGLPPGLLSRVRQVESGGNDQAVSSAGAEGPFQLMPATAQEYGVNNAFNLAQAAPAAAKMLGGLMNEFHGNLREAVAAYNWGAGNVSNDVSQNGSDWEDHLPQETQNYLEKVLSGAMRSQAPSRQPTQVKIDISNRTGGSAIITTKTIAI